MGADSIEYFSDQLAFKAAKESDYFPIDRYFLNDYIQEILYFDNVQFIRYNLETKSSLYSVHLMYCLPELWRTIGTDEIVNLCETFKNVNSYFSLIQFTYKYLEINIIDLLMKLSLEDDIKTEIRMYVKRQYNTFLKSPSDYLFLENEVIGVRHEDWDYKRQVFLLDSRVKPIFNEINKLREYAESI
jgi:hypothetical protein